ncbi:MAG: hypothetical protein DRG30_03605 [Epsilonproteobacteria bacterium]|nr:MAG: hypothetical protein DRG30_03605 [Campylobacterota bacterium]
MTTFKQLQENLNIHELIKSTFDVDLALAGNWGYTKENATIIEALSENMTLLQLEHMITSIRAHLEMNITQEQENRYGAINANERAREEERNEEGVFNKVTYEITAIKEDLYNAFIKEYKEGYGKEDFDISSHFKRRKEATLTREVIHYFEVSSVQ